MAADREFSNAAKEMAERIRRTVPADLVELFEKASGLTPADFRSCIRQHCGEVSAVDGSNAFILESGSMAVVAVRAAQSTFSGMDRVRRSLTPLHLALIGNEDEIEDFISLYLECFGQRPGIPLQNDDRNRTAGILRDTVEYWVMAEMAATLNPGALLLRDGPLRVSHASHDPVLSRIEDMCVSREIMLAGVSKQTSATWGGGHPLLPSVAGLADAFKIRAPWWIRIDPAMLDRTQFSQWQHGEMYVASLHRGARSPLKIELRNDLPDQEAQQIMDRLAACSGDGRIPGYPYPLFDAHRTVVLTKEIVADARSNLLNLIASAGIRRHTYEILFGDYHDEFARY